MVFHNLFLLQQDGNAPITGSPIFDWALQQVPVVAVLIFVLYALYKEYQKEKEYSRQVVQSNIEIFKDVKVVLESIINTTKASETRSEDIEKLLLRINQRLEDRNI